MAKTSVTGLALRDSLLEWVALSADKGEEIARCALPLDPSSPTEETATAGQVPREEQARAACRGIEGAVVLGIPLSLALVRVIDLPPVDPSEVEGLVALQVEKMSPFPVERSVFGYEPIEETERGARILVALARESDVLEASEFLRAAGVRADRVDIDALGLVRLLLADGRVPGAGLHVVFLCTAGRLDLAIVRHGRLAALRSFGNMGNTAPEDVALETTCTLMGLELEQGVETPDGAHFLHDGTEGADAFGASLSSALRCELAVEAIFSGPTGGALGLAQRRLYDHPVDLRPEAWKSRARSAAFKRKLLRVCATAVAVWALALGLMELALWRMRIARDSVLARVEAIADAADEVRANRRLIRDLDRYSERDRSALECLLFVVNYMPVGGMELSMFAYTKGRSVRIGGDAVEAELIYDMKKRIDESGFFAGSVLSPITAGRGVQRFELEMFFNQEGGA